MFFEQIKKVKLEIILFLVFILYRIPLLGSDMLNLDGPVWKSRIFEFSSALFSLDFAKTAVTYHPGVVLMWLGAIGVKLFNIFGDFMGTTDTSTVAGYVGMHFSQKIMLVIFMAFIYAVCVYIIKSLYGYKFALLLFVLLTFEPYFLGLTRVLHTDGLITALSFLSVLSLHYYFRLYFDSKKIFKINFLWVILSGFSVSLALLTKSNSLFLVAFNVLAMFIYCLFYIKSKSFLWRIVLSIFTSIKIFSIWLIVVCVGFVIFWPAMWVSPLETLQLYVSGITDVGFEVHYQAWFGIEVADPGATFYPIITFIRLTPWFIVLSFSGILLFIYNAIRYKKIDSFHLISFLFIVLYTLLLSIPEKKLGRYMLPNLPYIAIFATWFVSELLEIIEKTYKKAKKYSLSYLATLLFFLLSFVSAYKIFPDYLMYYSPFVLGYSGGSQIEEPKWPLGYYSLAQYLNGLPNSDTRYVLVRYGYVFNPFYNGPTGTTSQRTEKDPGAYFILEKYSDFRYLRGKAYKQVEVVKVGGLDYFWVYEITGNFEGSNEYKFVFPSGLRIDPRFN